MLLTGDIFFGKNFGCLEDGKAPQILLDLDEVFPAYWVEWQFPWLHKLLMIVPSKGLHNFLTAGHRFYGVSLSLYSSRLHPRRCAADDCTVRRQSL